MFASGHLETPKIVEGFGFGSGSGLSPVVRDVVDQYGELGCMCTGVLCLHNTCRSVFAYRHHRGLLAFELVFGCYRSPCWSSGNCCHMMARAVHPFSINENSSRTLSLNPSLFILAQQIFFVDCSRSCRPRHWLICGTNGGRSRSK